MRVRNAALHFRIGHFSEVRTRSGQACYRVKTRSAAWSILLDWTYQVKETGVCIVDDTGSRLSRSGIDSSGTPESQQKRIALISSSLSIGADELTDPYRFKQIGIEVGLLSQCSLFSALGEAGLPGDSCAMAS